MWLPTQTSSVLYPQLYSLVSETCLWTAILVIPEVPNDFTLQGPTYYNLISLRLLIFWKTVSTVVLPLKIKQIKIRSASTEQVCGEYNASLSFSVRPEGHDIVWGKMKKKMLAFLNIEISVYITVFCKTEILSWGTAGQELLAGLLLFWGVAICPNVLILSDVNFQGQKKFSNLQGNIL